MCRILATDLDGTLFYPKRKIRMIDKKNLAMLERHFSRGGKVILVTGRNVPFIRKVQKKLKHPVDIVSCSGAYVEANGEILNDEVLPSNIGRDIYKMISESFSAYAVSILGRNGSMGIHYHKIGLLKKFLFRFLYIFEGVYAEKHTRGEKKILSMIDDNLIYKLMFYFGVGEKGNQLARKAAEMIHAKYPDLELAIEKSMLEITNAGCQKAKGLERICEYYGYKKEQFVVIGDSENDVPMFLAFPNSVCMSHANEKVQQKAQHIVHHFDKVESYLKGE